MEVRFKDIKLEVMSGNAKNSEIWRQGRRFGRGTQARRQHGHSPFQVAVLKYVEDRPVLAVDVKRASISQVSRLWK